jgi:hypothetical protein
MGVLPTGFPSIQILESCKVERTRSLQASVPAAFSKAARFVSSGGGVEAAIRCAEGARLAGLLEGAVTLGTLDDFMEELDIAE